MKSWLELSREEQQNLISEYRSVSKNISSNTLHTFNIILLVGIVPLALIVIARVIAGTMEYSESKLMLFALIILLIIYFFNIYKIKKDNVNFSNWLKTKDIIK